MDPALDSPHFIWSKANSPSKNAYFTNAFLWSMLALRNLDSREITDGLGRHLLCITRMQQSLFVQSKELTTLNFTLFHFFLFTFLLLFSFRLTTEINYFFVSFNLSRSTSSKKISFIIVYKQICIIIS